MPRELLIVVTLIKILVVLLDLQIHRKAVGSDCSIAVLAGGFLRVRVGFLFFSIFPFVFIVGDFFSLVVVAGVGYRPAGKFCIHVGICGVLVPHAYSHKTFCSLWCPLSSSEEAN